MSKKPYAALNRIFHEPNRLAIVSALCTAEDGLLFKDLKEECNLTDGNLSRHLRSLHRAGMIRIRKTFVKAKPQTSVYLTNRGRESFVRYLEALEAVLQKAAESVRPEKPGISSLLRKPARV